MALRFYRSARAPQAFLAARDATRLDRAARAALNNRPTGSLTVMLLPDRAIPSAAAPPSGAVR